MASTDSDDAWTTTDEDTIRRIASREDLHPVSGPDETGVPRLASSEADGEPVEWPEFFGTLSGQDLAVAVAVGEGGGWSLDVVPADAGDEATATIRRALEDASQDDPAESHHEAAREDANVDDHRDEPPHN